MKQDERQWLGSVPWETVLSLNQALCKAQQTAHQPKEKSYELARQLWEQSVNRKMSLPAVLEVCRRCYELAPFTFNNGNTFASVSKNLIEDALKSLPPVEAQILGATVAHYVAGQIEKKELLQVLRHFETRWELADTAPRSAPALVVPRQQPQL